MRPNYKPNLNNRPKHIFVNDSIYFITSRCVDAQWFLQPDKYKSLLFDIIKEKIEKFDYSLLAYVILHNHYHILIQVKDASTLKKFIAELNGASSRAINRADFVIDRKIWWNYFDHIIRDEEDFFKHLNYIHQNPIKHGITKDFSYKYSSYDEWARKKGKEYLDQSFEKYPIVDFKQYTDDY